MVEKYYTSVYLAYLDFLGFSSFVNQIFDTIDDEAIDNLEEEKQKRKLEHMKYQYENKVISLIKGEMVGYQTKNTHRKYLGKEIHVPNFNESQFNSLIFSDSVFIWTENDSFEAFEKLTFALNRIIKNSLVLHSLPIRGSITRGFVVISNVQYPTPHENFITTIYGDAIVRAVELEKVQDWAGCLIDEECISFLKNNKEEWNNFIHKKIIMEYNAPIKNSKNESSYYVLNWVGQDLSLTPNDYFNIIQKWFRNPKLKVVEDKMENTKDFVKYVLGANHD